MKRLTAEQMQREASAFTKALVGTTERYLNNLMCESTWKSHMKSLWAQVERAPQPVQLQVRALVGSLGTPAIWKGCSKPPTRSKRYYSDGAK